MIRIGVLALQGSFREHLDAIARIDGVVGSAVRDEEDLNKVDSLIIPGGESTTIGKLIRKHHLIEALQRKINEGMPVWGTCAGMILLADKIIEEDTCHLGVMDIAVRRNAYGGQLESFGLAANVFPLSQQRVPLVFIRAPQIESIGTKVEIIVSVEGKPVFVRQGNRLASSFHPELIKELIFHEYFVSIVRKVVEEQKSGLSGGSAIENYNEVGANR